MFESLEGLRIPETRQNAGSLLIAGPFGGVNDPEVTASAVLMVAPGSASVAKLSHVVATAGSVTSSAIRQALIGTQYNPCGAACSSCRRVAIGPVPLRPTPPQTSHT